MIPLYTNDQFQTAKPKDILPFQCLHCLKTFYKMKGFVNLFLDPNRSETGDFCSTQCQNNHRIQTSFMNCKVCNNIVKVNPYRLKHSKNIFCSSKCAAQYNSKHKKHGYRTSKLENWIQKKLSLTFPILKIDYNLNQEIGYELDIFISSLKLAFELNGIFHYQPIYGIESLNNQKRIDKIKQELCISKNITLIIIDTREQVYFKETSSEKYLSQIISKIEMVRLEGVEPPRLAAHAPKACVYANFTTDA